MAFKLVSKNNIGIFTTLILVVLLSQSRFFDLLTDTPLGRMALLAFVIFIAYTNQILGLIAVLCIIIAFNNNVNIVSGYNLYEGFDSSSNIVDKSNKEDNKIKEKIEEKQKTDTDLINKAKKEPSKSSLENNKAREGFCMTDRESNMLRGKQSNTISVFNNLREQSDDVSPSDKSIFTSEYASF